MSLAYVLNPLDRRANDRPNAEWVLQQRRRADAKLIRIAGDAALLQGGRLVTDNDATAESAVFLGLDAQDVPWFAFRTEAADRDIARFDQPKPVRSVALLLDHCAGIKTVTPPGTN